jgi:hypothetical protein
LYRWVDIAEFAKIAEKLRNFTIFANIAKLALASKKSKKRNVQKKARDLLKTYKLHANNL